MREQANNLRGNGMDSILQILEENRDKVYGAFQGKLIPTVEQETIIGVRTPVLRKLAKKLRSEPEGEAFLQELPHRYFDENQLHGFLISEEKDFARCMEELERFLPFIDKWATCDQTAPKVFRKHRKELLPYIRRWLGAEHTYTVRFAVGMLMTHYLDEDFRDEYLNWAAEIHSEEYYVNMEIAWYFATALAKQWDAAILLLEDGRLDQWVHNRTIRKAVESYRITAEQKAYLKKLVRKK